LLEAGDRQNYEDLRRIMPAKYVSETGSLPAAIMKACLLLSAGPDLLQWVAERSEPDAITNGRTARIRPTGHGVALSDAKVLIDYRLGDFADVSSERLLGETPARLATFSLIQAMAVWQKKDYWGAMVIWTKSYALLQAAARQGLVPLTVGSEIFPGLSEPDYLQAPWYDWAVADLLLREWNEMLGEAEQSLDRIPRPLPTLEDIAIARAAGECHALRGEWAEALTCSRYCLKSNQHDSLDHATMDYENAAIACLELGDENSYLRLREEMATRFKDADEVAPWRTLEVGLLRPVDDRVAGIFGTFAAGLARWDRIETNDSWGLMLVSLHSYRRGDYPAAIDLAGQSLARIQDGARLPNAELSLIVALCQNQQGNRSAALSELEQAASVIRTGFDLDYDVWHWRHWVMVRLLLQEARGLIPQAPPSQSSGASH